MIIKTKFILPLAFVFLATSNSHIFSKQEAKSDVVSVFHGLEVTAPKKIFLNIEDFGLLEKLRDIDENYSFVSVESLQTHVEKRVKDEGIQIAGVEDNWIENLNLLTRSGGLTFEFAPSSLGLHSRWPVYLKFYRTVDVLVGKKEHVGIVCSWETVKTFNIDGNPKTFYSNVDDLLTEFFKEYFRYNGKFDEN